jgi:hypothetical protein
MSLPQAGEFFIENVLRGKGAAKKSQLLVSDGQLQNTESIGKNTQYIS